MGEMADLQWGVGLTELDVGAALGLELLRRDAGLAARDIREQRDAAHRPCSTAISLSMAHCLQLLKVVGGLQQKEPGNGCDMHWKDAGQIAQSNRTVERSSAAGERDAPTKIWQSVHSLTDR